jgi:hypothetical protein
MQVYGAALMIKAALMINSSHDDWTAALMIKGSCAVAAMADVSGRRMEPCMK